MNELPDIENLYRLDGKVCIVTGASSGFGVRFAKVLSAAGAKVVVAARRRDRLEELAGGLPDALAIQCDVSDDEQCRELIARSISHYGRVDVLVNNAGISDAINPAEEANIDVFRNVVDVNLNSCFLLSGLAAQDMLTREEGSIINVASVHGIVASAPNLQPAYAASKAGLVNLTRDLAVQWAKRGIRVNALCPGYFETELTQVMFDDERSSRWIARNASMGRGGTPDELDGALLFLASDASSYVTGIPLPVDGGWLAR
ncbi:MAG: glucose 1-dehydrogenase [Actinomycetota bacterium]|jgi:NAD(P)-dependent dehydrogenase (short-subunit alcohol dehydrogenase family)|nr:glucose 1-dehydrogenase [Actinomycetota bacterium]MED5361698.1 glucose 1-dehydrogenase [Actinomycetota bacterium]MEE3256450.1 glucose 1-dehydrogenase [Actinomycetota bacterium]